MFHNLHPTVKGYVSCLLTHKFGVQKSLADVAVRHTLHQMDRIAVSVPYCRESLTWELTFKLDDLFSPPDVIAMDTAVEAIPVKDIQEILPILDDWCPEKEHLLLDLILQLIDLHRFSQVRRLRESEEINRQLFEYESLTEMGNVRKEDLELSVTQAARGTCVSFHLALPLDLDDLPLEVKDQKDSTAFLTISYRIPGQTIIDLRVSSYLTKLIGKVDPPILPTDVALVQYVPVVRKKITDMIEACRKNYEKKQHFFAALVSRLGTSILNADSDKFSKIAFLFNRGNRKLPFVIEIPFRFPVDKPVVKMLVEEAWAPYTTQKEIKFPFERKWTADQMALEMLKGVLNFRTR